MKTIKIEKGDPQKAVSSASGVIFYDARLVTSSTSGSSPPINCTRASHCATHCGTSRVTGATEMPPGFTHVVRR
jgi:hypothetical protein